MAKHEPFPYESELGVLETEGWDRQRNDWEDGPAIPYWVSHDWNMGWYIQVNDRNIHLDLPSNAYTLQVARILEELIKNIIYNPPPWPDPKPDQHQKKPSAHKYGRCGGSPTVFGDCSCIR